MRMYSWEDLFSFLLYLSLCLVAKPLIFVHDKTQSEGQSLIRLQEAGFNVTENNWKHKSCLFCSHSVAY